MHRPLRKISQLGLFLMLLTQHSFTLASAQESLIFACGDSYAPFCQLSGGKMEGFLVELMAIINKEMPEYQIQTKGFPWARAQKQVFDGDADILVTTPTQARLKYVDFVSEPLVSIPAAAFVSRRPPSLTQMRNFDQVSEFAVFNQVNYFGNGWIKEITLPNVNMHLVSDLSTALKLISAQRHDIIIGNRLVISHQVMLENLQDHIVQIPLQNLSTDFNFGVRKSHPQKTELLKRLREISTNQKFKQKLSVLVAAYSVPDANVQAPQ